MVRVRFILPYLNYFWLHGVRSVSLLFPFVFKIRFVPVIIPGFSVPSPITPPTHEVQPSLSFNPCIDCSRPSSSRLRFSSSSYGRLRPSSCLRVFLFMSCPSKRVAIVAVRCCVVMVEIRELADVTQPSNSSDNVSGLSSLVLPYTVHASLCPLHT